MSFNFYWKELPAPSEVEHGDLDYALKRALAPAIFGHDGTLRGETILEASELDFLRGVRAMCTEKQAKEIDTLMNQIHKNGRVLVWIGEGDEY